MRTRQLWRSLTGRRWRSVQLIAVLFSLGLYYFKFHASQRSQSTTDLWLKQADYIPEEEYDLLLLERSSRPHAWPRHAWPHWRASPEQQRELNQVIKTALQSRSHGAAARGEELWSMRRDQVKAAIKHSWDAYARDAFGSDEYHPLSHRGENMTQSGVGYFIADVLDTLLLAGLTEEYTRGRNHLVSTLTFDQPGVVSLFETTIRVLGGLLSAYYWSGETDAELLRLADELGGRLAWSFDTENGIPPEMAVLRPTGKPFASLSSTSEITTLQLEFRYLAKLTGKLEYRDSVDRIMDAMFKARKFDGLVPIFVNAKTADFVNDTIRLGSRGDSYYEYLLKQHLQTRQSEPMLRSEYDAAMEGVKRYLVTVSPNQKLTYVGELLQVGHEEPLFNPKMDHLVCFLAGNLALGATQGRALSDIPPSQLSARDREDLILARELADTCMHMYNETNTGLAPELVYFRHNSAKTDSDAHFDISDQLVHPDGDILVRSGDRHSLLRPETIESLFVLWRITGEEKWRESGWRIFCSLEKWARLPVDGFSSLRDVTTVPPPRDDKLETFFVSETLKYLYLLFDGSETVPLTRYVFNTEAHPLPLFTWD